MEAPSSSEKSKNATEAEILASTMNDDAKEILQHLGLKPIDTYDSDENDDDYYDEDEDDNYDFQNETNGKSPYDIYSKFDDMSLPSGVEASVPWLVQSPPTASNSKLKEVVEDEISIEFMSFRQFGIVEGYSDNHYAQKEVTGTSKEWTKRIQHEWNILEKDLPDKIFVRVYEDRMDLLRAVIIGPAGTPYHDGLFFFDAQFPPTYPNVPPTVYYHSGGLRLNPNLYDNGYVCLSLLGTWSGEDCETWRPPESTMLQVLVSIQALVLNEKPYFNEPGYETYSKTTMGEKHAMRYNNNAFLLSCRTMLYSLRRPPKHFEIFTAGHFRNQGPAILEACKGYLNGAPVGSTVKEKAENKDAVGSTVEEKAENKDAVGSNVEEKAENKDEDQRKMLNPRFKESLEKLFEELLMEFTVKGADCDCFLALKAKAGLAATAEEASSNSSTMEQ